LKAFSRAWSVLRVSYQQEGAEGRYFPKEEEPQQVVRKNDPEHRPHEHEEEGEEKRPTIHHLLVSDFRGTLACIRAHRDKCHRQTTPLISAMRTDNYQGKGLVNRDFGAVRMFKPCHNPSLGKHENHRWKTSGTS